MLESLTDPQRAICVKITKSIENKLSKINDHVHHTMKDRIKDSL